MDAATLSQYLDYPIQAPPEGVQPNFVDPDSIAYQVYIMAAVCLPLMLTFACIRFISKRYRGPKTVITDEIVFCIGLVFSVVFFVVTIVCVSGGAFGRHAWNVLLKAFTKQQLVLALLVEVLLPLAMCSVKTSVLLLYRQLFGILRWMRVITTVGIIINISYHLSMSVSYAVMCSPTTGQSQFDFLAAFVSDTCARTRIVVLLQGVGNVVIDMFLFILPLPAVWALHIPLRRKIAISSMFLIGLSACASSIIGLSYRAQYYSAGQDNIRLAVPLWVTAMAEVTAGVIICCMPTTAIVFKAVKAPILTWLSSASGRALRITGSSRSGIPLSGSNSNLKGSGSLKNSREPSEAENVWDTTDYNSKAHDHYAAWIDKEADTVPMQEMHLGNTGIGKTTEIMISRAA